MICCFGRRPSNCHAPVLEKHKFVHHLWLPTMVSPWSFRRLFHKSPTFHLSSYKFFQLPREATFPIPASNIQEFTILLVWCIIPVGRMTPLALPKALRFASAARCFETPLKVNVHKMRWYAIDLNPSLVSMHAQELMNSYYTVFFKDCHYHACFFDLFCESLYGFLLNYF